MVAPPIRVLVVDDDPLFQQALAALLERDERVRVVGFAADGEQAVARSLLLRPDVVTMDIDMPGVDGVEATRRLLEQLPDVRVVVVSGSAHAGRAQAARAAGAAGYLTKSCAVTDLIASIVAVRDGEEFVLAM